MTIDGVKTRSTARPRRANRPWRVPLFALLGAVAAYAIVGYLIVPSLVERDLRRFVAARTAQALAIERVVVNPFRFEARLHGIALAPAPDGPAVEVELLTLRLAARSLLPGPWVFDEATLEAPRVRWQGTVVADRGDPAPAVADWLETWLPDADVRLLQASRGELRLTAAEPAGATSVPPLHVHELSLQIDRWQGGSDREPVENAPFVLSARMQAGKIEASGTLGAGARHLTADFRLVDLDLVPTAALWGLDPSLELQSALVSADAHLDWSAAGATWQAAADVTDLRLTETSDGAPVLRVERLLAADLHVDRGRLHRWGALKLERPQLTLVRTAAGELNAGGALLAQLRSALRNRRSRPARIELADGQLLWIDGSLRPIVRLDIDAVDGSARLVPLDPSDSEPFLSLTGSLDGTVAELQAHHASSDGRSPGLTLALSDFPLPPLSPYFAKLTTRQIEGGTLDLQLRWPVDEMPAPAAQDGIGTPRFIARGLLLNAPAEGEAPSPTDLYLALLEDEQGILRTTLAPSEDDSSNPWSAGHLFEQLGDAFLGQVDAITAKPFAALATVTEARTTALDTLHFEAGSAALSPAMESRLDALANALRRRPRLTLQLMPSLDRQIDRAALARQQMRLHVALAASAVAFGRPPSGPPAFDDPKVRSVLDEFARERLPSRQRERIAADHDPSDDSYFVALFEALVTNEPVSAAALQRLARYRARAARNALVNRGLAADRVAIADGLSDASFADARVRMPLALRGTPRSRAD